MNELADLQRQFQDFLLTGKSEIANSIVQTDLVAAQNRLGIYRDAYSLRLIESLTANFPALFAYLGCEEFNKLSHAYILNYPSTNRSIRWYGDLLANFVANFYPKHPYLAELAYFEWKMTLVFDAPDSAAVKVEDMANVPSQAWGNLRFTLHPSVKRINHFWNVAPIWQALVHERELPDRVQGSKKAPWVMWRAPDYLIQFYSLSHEEAWLLDSIIQGLSFPDLCEGLCQWIKPEEVGMRAASYLKRWIQHGMIGQLITD